MVSVTMPQLGESVTEGTVAKWLKREGEPVARYEPLVEIITDKVNSEIPSPEAGVLSRILVPEGRTVKVGTEIAVIEPATPGREPAPAAQLGAAVEPAPAHEATPTQEATLAIGEDRPRYTEEEARRRSSPLVRRLAKEHGIDLSLVAGTGAGGRVTKDDLLAYIESRAVAARGEVAPPPPPVPAAALEIATPPPPSPAAPAAPGAPEEILPVSPMRRAIAEHMVRSVTTAPHAWTYVEVDVAGMVRWREQVRAEFRAREGFDLTYVPFVAKAVVESLREHPILNSTWRDGQIVLKKRIHLGIAVALEDGLIVPVIHDADERSIAGLARAVHDLATRARAGKLTPQDVQGGTFTLNNTGAVGSILSMPIIHQPQAAILTMEAITRRVVVTADDAIAIRPILNMCLSFDHRICDGLQAGRFLQAVRQKLQAMGPGGSLY